MNFSGALSIALTFMRNRNVLAPGGDRSVEPGSRHLLKFLLSAWFGMCVVAQEPVALFSKDSTEPAAWTPSNGTQGPYKRIRSAEIGRECVSAAAGLTIRPGERIILNLFRGTEFKALLTEVRVGEHGWHASGFVEDSTGSLVLLSGHGDAIAGTVAVPGQGRFRFNGSKHGRMQVFELSDAVPRCGTCDQSTLPLLSTPSHRPGFTKQSIAPVLDPLTNRVSLVDLMVVHTTAARDGAGGDAAIRALVELAVAEANAVYQNSRANVRLRLIEQREVSYAESTSFSTNLARLRLQDDGFLDEIHGWRTTNKADLVCMITEGGDIGFGGLASLMLEPKPESRSFAFSVVRRENAVGSFVFVHEITHNFGCQHDREHSLGSDGMLMPGVFPYSFGRRFSSDGVLYRTVMAYPPGEVVPFLSTPTILFRGVPLGIAGEDLEAGADNVRTINTTAAIVSSYFGEASDTLVPSVIWKFPAEGQVIPFGQKIRIEVEASDPDGQLKRVEFYDGNALAQLVVNPSPGKVSTEIELAAAGSHELFVRVVDHSGADSALVKRMVVVRPPNDEFSKRTAVTGETFSIRASNSGATRELGEPIHADNQGAGSVWFEWTCPRSGTITLTTSGDRYTEIVDVYTGSKLSSLARTLRTVRFNSQLRTCVATLDVVAGQAYAIAVDSLPGTGESFSLALAYHEAPANDAFGTRSKLEGSQWNFSGSNDFCSTEPGEPRHAGFAGGKSVWFEWEAPRSGSVLVTCSGPNVAWLLDVYQGSALTNLSTVAGRFLLIDQERDFSTIVFTAVSGQTYQLAVDGSMGLSGPYTVSLEYPPALEHDAFSKRRSIQGTNVFFTDTSFAATSEPNEPAHAGTSVAKSLWYSWTAPVSGPVKISMTGQGFSVLPDAYQGGAIASLKVVNRGIKVIPGMSSELSFQAVLGETYQIVADGFGGKGGDFSFSLITSNQPAQLFGKASLGPETTDFRFQIGGSPGQRYAVESSVDLLSWTSIRTGLIGGEPEVFQETVPAGKGWKFYRVLPLP